MPLASHWPLTIEKNSASVGGNQGHEDAGKRKKRPKLTTQHSASRVAFGGSGASFDSLNDCVLRIRKCFFH